MSEKEFLSDLHGVLHMMNAVRRVEGRVVTAWGNSPRRPYPRDISPTTLEKGVLMLAHEAECKRTHDSYLPIGAVLTQDRKCLRWAERTVLAGTLVLVVGWGRDTRLYRKDLPEILEVQEREAQREDGFKAQSQIEVKTWEGAEIRVYLSDLKFGPEDLLKGFCHPLLGQE